MFVSDSVNVSPLVLELEEVSNAKLNLYNLI